MSLGVLTASVTAVDTGFTVSTKIPVILTNQRTVRFQVAELHLDGNRQLQIKTEHDKTVLNQKSTENIDEGPGAS